MNLSGNNQTMTRTQLTELLLRFADDSQSQFIDQKAFVESLNDESFDKFATGYLLGISVRLKAYEELLGVKLTELPAPDLPDSQKTGPVSP
jgi:hypothetical protein